MSPEGLRGDPPERPSGWDEVGGGGGGGEGGALILPLLFLLLTPLLLILLPLIVKLLGSSTGEPLQPTSLGLRGRNAPGVFLVDSDGD